MEGADRGHVIGGETSYKGRAWDPRFWKAPRLPRLTRGVRTGASGWTDAK